MHAVKEGPANRSFGLQVAALAGLPRSVIAEARRTLAELENGGHLHSPGAARLVGGGEPKPQADLFVRHEPSAAERALADLDPDALTPREALEALYRLKALGRGSAS
jgi:DNA mismatch repair protein MutS